jgi:pimeloyl-ACP methyl ester carboxylesterase
MSEPIVFLPGLFCDARVFSSQLAALGRDHPVMVAPTAIRDRVEGVASDLLMSMPSRFVLVGQGYGGVVAMEMLRRAPEKISRLILMSCSPLADTPVEAADRELRIVAAKANRFADVVQQEVPADCLGPSNARGDITAKMLAMAKATGPEAYVTQARAMQRRRDQQSTLRKVKQPTLVICGTEDRLTPVKRHEAMAQLIPNSKLAVLNNCGHLPSLEAPSTVSDTLRMWLKEPEPAT